ncbi:H/ACA ribonucleoprotein complex non-core subunit NAF1 protein [Dioscorea alata]|uniref:H/ACA ribonucleoprotein complex non-core subunit NAF1 protein n=1 Tax=Dioscorea alata TaxID=55571 RepID=A0ACB7U3C0_DIOAL|nr:H/ACA ribonucleoprotein complex non-core subunit NAF1 protein [Dioscorea alata]
MVGWRIPAIREAPGQPFLDSVLDFDPVVEWLVDPDLSPMSISNAGDAKIEPKEDDVPSLHESRVEESELPKEDYVPAVHESRADESELLGSPIDEKMDKVSLNPVINGGSEAVASTDEKSKKMEHFEEVLGSEQANGTQGVGLDSKGEEEEVVSESESDEESSSEQASSSEEEDDDGGDEVEEAEEGEIMEDVIVSSDEEGIVMKGPIKSKNEIEDLPPVPPVDVCLEPHHQTLPVGVISSIIGSRVIVEGSEKHNPLSEGSILWITETRSPLGVVDEIFGPVKNPYYIVRYNSDTEIADVVKEGKSVSFVLEFANHVLSDKDIYKKGYDASGENDEEMTDEVEFSDDEKEAEYRRSLRQTKRATGHSMHSNRECGVNKKRNDRKVAGAKKNARAPNLHARAATDQSLPFGPGSTHASSSTSDGNPSFSSGGGAFPMPPTILPAERTGACLNHPLDQSLQHPPSSVWAHSLPPPQQQLNASGPGMLLQQQPNVWPNDMLPQQQQLGAWALGVLLQQQQQQNALAQGFSPLQQLIGLQGGLGGASYPHPQNPALNAYPNAMASQQPFLPQSSPPLGGPWNGGLLNLSVNPMVTRPIGQTGFGLAQIGPSNGQDPRVFEGQNPAAIRQAGQQPRPFLPGRSSPHARRQHGRGGRHSFGRGNRAPGR